MHDFYDILDRFILAAQRSLHDRGQGYVARHGQVGGFELIAGDVLLGLKRLNGASVFSPHVRRV